MGDFSEQNKTQSTIFSLMCDVSTGKFSDIPENESNYVKSPCTSKIYVINCKDKFLQEHIDDVEGLNIELKSIKGYDNTLLPHYIPIIDRDSANKYENIDGTDTIGVRLSDIFPKLIYRSKGTWRCSDNYFMNVDFLKNKIFYNKKVILFSDGPDNLLEPLWYNRLAIDLFNKLNSMGFSCITGADFSVCPGECPVGQMINLNKSLLYSSEIEKSGTQSIPHLYSVTNYQRKITADWLNKRPNINLICINSQMQRRNKVDLAELKHTIIYLIKNVKQNLHIIIHGFPMSKKYIDGLSEVIDRLHFANSAPFFNSNCKHLQTYNLSNEKIEVKYSPLDKKILVEKSILACNLFVKNLNLKQRGESIYGYNKLLLKKLDLKEGIISQA